jgi:hypothetical protein
LSPPKIIAQIARKTVVGIAIVIIIVVPIAVTVWCLKHVTYEHEVVYTNMPLFFMEMSESVPIERMEELLKSEVEDVRYLAKDKWIGDPIEAAAFFNRSDIVNLLIDYGFDAEATLRRMKREVEKSSEVKLLQETLNRNTITNQVSKSPAARVPSESKEFWPRLSRLPV